MDGGGFPTDFRLLPGHGLGRTAFSLPSSIYIYLAKSVTIHGLFYNEKHDYFWSSSDGKWTELCFGRSLVAYVVLVQDERLSALRTHSVMARLNRRFPMNKISDFDRLRIRARAFIAVTCNFDTVICYGCFVRQHVKEWKQKLCKSVS